MKGRLNRCLYFSAGLEAGGRWSHWPRGTTGPAPPAAPGPPRGGRTGTPGRAAGAQSQAVKPVAAFAPSPSAPRGALLPTDPPSEGLWGHPRPLCLPLCPSRLHPWLPTSSLWALSPEGLWVWVGTCPPDFSSSTFSLQRRVRGERRGRRELEWRGQEETRDPVSWRGPGQSSWEGWCWGRHWPIAFLPAPSPAQGLLSPLTLRSLPGRPGP